MYDADPRNEQDVRWLSHEQDVRWLSPEQRQAWLSMVRVLTVLPAALDAQLERDAGLTFFEYHVLSMLSERPDRALRMRRLAQLTSASPSRLSNVVKRLEARGLVRREPDPDDGRATRAVLTAAGLRTIVETAPRHVAAVRDLLIDVLSPAQLRDLHTAQERVLARLDPDAATRPEWFDA